MARTTKVGLVYELLQGVDIPNFDFGAQGRIRTCVACKAPRLQRGVIDRSTTCAKVASAII